MGPKPTTKPRKTQASPYRPSPPGDNLALAASLILLFLLLFAVLFAAVTGYVPDPAP